MRINIMPLAYGMLVASVIMTSCQHQAPVVKDEETTKDSISDEARLDLQLISVNIPSPLEVTSELSKAGFNYNKGLLNPSSRASSYTTNFKIAVNLGVYGADMGYVTAYNQTQDAIDYLSRVSPLADKVGVAAAFDQALAKKFEANAGKKDSLAEFINAAYQKAERNLRSNQRVSVAALIASGGWIEGLYLASQAIGTTPKNDKNADVYKRLWNHLYSFTYVAKLLNEYKSNADCAQMISELKEVEQISKSLENKTNLTQEDVTNIKEKVAAVRNKIVG